MKVKWQSDAPNMELKVPSEIKIDGYIPTAQDLTFTGDCSYFFKDNRFNWLLEYYASLFSFSDIQKADSCFYAVKTNADLTNLTFYMKDGSNNNINSMFAYSNLQHLPRIVGKVDSCQQLFYNCSAESIPDNFFDDFIFSKPNSYIQAASIFTGCQNITKVPSLKAFKQLQSTQVPSGIYYSFYYQLFSSCTKLQEIRDLPIVYGINSQGEKNLFEGMVSQAQSLSSFTFEPNQTARLSNQILYFSRTGYYYDYWFKHVKDSVYNHDSAVETINSLPDTSAFLAEVGGTNTIQFHSDQGANTEGGAIGNLTAEEIAVAAAKGWTVAFGK